MRPAQLRLQEARVDSPDTALTSGTFSSPLNNDALTLHNYHLGGTAFIEDVGRSAAALRHHAPCAVIELALPGGSLMALATARIPESIVLGARPRAVDHTPAGIEIVPIYKKENVSCSKKYQLSQ
jgi:hypothetical protein